MALNNAHQTPLFVAVKTGNHEMIDLLVNNGTNVNAIDCIGRPPLHYAIQIENNPLQVAAHLIASGAKTDTVDMYGNTSLSVFYSAELHRQNENRLTGSTTSSGWVSADTVQAAIKNNTLNRAMFKEILTNPALQKALQSAKKGKSNHATIYSYTKNICSSITSVTLLLAAACAFLYSRA